MRFSCFTALLALAMAGCSSGPPTQVLNTYLLGEKIQLGHISYTVFDTQWLTQIGEGPAARIPQHRFFLIRLSASNGSNSEAPVPNMTIRDDKGKEYEEVSDGSGVPQWAGYLRVAKPTDTVAGNVMFDAPAGHYKLKVSDEKSSQFALIDIPLSYGNETPEMVAPGEKKQ